MTARIGDTKECFCPTCGRDTQWEYIAVQLPDGIFGLQNLVNPEAHQVKLWRCCCHQEPDGRLVKELRRHKHTTSVETD